MIVKSPETDPESGNVIFFVLLGIMLIGLVTAAIQSGGLDGANVDREELILNAARIRQNASELERATKIILSNGVSESDISFADADAHADYGTVGTNPEAEIFHREGGAAAYRTPPPNVNGGEGWEFYGYTHLPDAGSSRAELIAVLPNVTLAFCDKINKINGYDSATQPSDTGNCLHPGAAQRFDAATKYAGTPNTTNEASFTAKPSMQGCVQCASDGLYHFYHVLHTR